MLVVPVLAAMGASTGWATGIVLARRPAGILGAFEFTRIQLIACSTILSLLCTALGYWQSVAWRCWPAFFVSICFGVVLGNLAMIECLRRAGPRRTELLLSLKGPVVALVAYVWLDEVLSAWDVVGVLVVLAGIGLAIQHGPDAEEPDLPALGGSVLVLLLGVGAAFFQGVGFLAMKPAMLAGTEPLAASAIRLLGAAVLVSILALWPARVFRSRVVRTPALLRQTIIPGVIGYVVSSSLLLYAYANLHAGVAAVLGSLSPIIVLPVLWITERRMPHFRAALGAALAVLGTGIILLL